MINGRMHLYALSIIKKHLTTYSMIDFMQEIAIDKKDIRIVHELY